MVEIVLRIKNKLVWVLSILTEYLNGLDLRITNMSMFMIVGSMVFD